MIEFLTYLFVGGFILALIVFAALMVIAAIGGAVTLTGFLTQRNK